MQARTLGLRGRQNEQLRTVTAEMRLSHSKITMNV